MPVPSNEGRKNLKRLMVEGAAYLHCAKALLRSKLWEDDYKVDRDALPSYAQMLKDQVPATKETAEELEQIIATSYKTTLY